MAFSFPSSSEPGESTMSEETLSEHLQSCLDRLRAGDQSVHEELWDLVNDRLTVLTRKMKRGDFRSVEKWSQTEDIAQNARVRLLRALADAVPQTPRDFYGLANLQIRRELLDTVRHFQGRKVKRDGPVQMQDGMDAASDTFDPVTIGVWSEVHKAISELPDVERESFELWYYQGLPHKEIAELLAVDESTVKRRCRAARGKLAQMWPQSGDSPMT
jgi:RNA polymerase sigma factor (sigma-70 family)